MHGARADVPSINRLGLPFVRIGHGEQHLVAMRPPLDAADRPSRAQFGLARDHAARTCLGAPYELPIGLSHEPLLLTPPRQQCFAACSCTSPPIGSESWR